MACIICLVAISRSSSERWARRSARPAWGDGGAGGLPTPAALHLLTRSCCMALESLAASVEEDEAAQDTCSTSSRADIKRTFPDMTECKKERKTRETSHLCQHSKTWCTKTEGTTWSVCVCVWRQQCLTLAVPSERVLWILLYDWN